MHLSALPANILAVSNTAPV